MTTVASPRRAVRLLDADPLLGADLGDAEADVATRALVAPLLAWEPGQAARLSPTRPGSVESVLILSGIVLEECTLGDVTHSRLLGAGDVVDPWAATGAGLMTRRWEPLERVQAAALSSDLMALASRWPAIARTLLRRSTATTERANAHSALLHLPNVRERLLAVLWCQAQRFGDPRPDGSTLLRLKLSHERLGRLSGARRPTVSLALGELAAAGLVERQIDGWLICAAAQDTLATLGLVSPSREAIAV